MTGFPGRIFRRVLRKYRLQKGQAALDGLDLKLSKYLDFDNGFFVEAGANDGINQSNTLYFEKNRRWKGLLIEPIPELAAKCRANRPQCIVENCALMPFSFREASVVMRYCNLMSVVKGSMKTEQEELAHIQQGRDIQRTETYEISVPACTLSAVLEKHRAPQIDLLSLDVEGSELSALQGLDLTRHRPKFMLIEARYRQDIDSFLASLYKPVADLSEHDVLYQLIRH